MKCALQSWSISCEWYPDRYRCSIRRDYSRLKSENTRLRDALKKFRDCDEC